MTTEGTIELSVQIKNTGSVQGIETVQFYIRDYVASWVRPIKELKGYEQISLEPGEEKEITFTVDNETLSFYRSNLTFGSEPGKFALMVGGNSTELLSKDIILVP